jgi:small subunit ribosomal protein S8
MSRTDLMGDVFTMVRNAIKAKKETVFVPYSKLVLKVCELLKKEGYIENFKEIELKNFRQIKIYLKYSGKGSIINEIKRVSKPGKRVYVGKHKIKPVLQGYGIAIISTSQGLLTDREAREKKVGGEVIGVVW